MPGTFLTKWVKWVFYQLFNEPRNQTKKKSEKWEKNKKKQAGLFSRLEALKNGEKKPKNGKKRRKIGKKWEKIGKKGKKSKNYLFMGYLYSLFTV